MNYMCVRALLSLHNITKAMQRRCYLDSCESSMTSTELTVELLPIGHTSRSLGAPELL